MGVPNYSGQIASSWGSMFEVGSNDIYVANAAALASGIRYGDNPPYTLNDLASIYPFFIGQARSFVGSTNVAINIISVSNTTGLVIGALVTGQGIPKGSYITAIETSVSVTLSQNTTAVGTNIDLSAYCTPPIPFPVLACYISLATASVNICVYNDSWFVMMALFVAHWCTLWASNNQSPNATLGQIVQSGAAAGIQIFKHAGDLSVNQQILDDLKGWGTYQLTSYGQQFASMAKIINSMSMLIY